MKSRSGAIPAERTIVALAEFGPPEVLQLVKEPMPQPGDGEALIEVEVVGVNFGDTMVRRGTYRKDLGPADLAPGSEFIGRVVALNGPNVGDGLIGRRVAAWTEMGGGYSDYAVVPARRVYPIPEDLPAGDCVALFFQGVTADYAVNRFGRVVSGDTVLVHAGAGGVGGLAIQLAASVGARVIATASTAAKRDIATAYGADLSLDSKSDATLLHELHSATDGAGCDVVIDGVGGPVFLPSLRALAIGGRYVMVGSVTQQPAVFDARHLLVRNQLVTGFILAHVADSEPDEPAATLWRLLEMLRTGKIKPRVTVMPLRNVVEAHRLLESRQTAGKLVLSAT